MRLTITLPELERGSSTQGGPGDRILDLKMLASRKEPVAISPITDHDHRIISVVRLMSSEPDVRKTSCRITFKPVWCKTFTLCSSTKDKLLAIICQFQEEQYWVDRDGYRKCTLTLGGNGTDPKVVHNAQFVMGDMLAAPERPEILCNVMQLIQNLF